MTDVAMPVAAPRRKNPINALKAFVLGLPTAYFVAFFVGPLAFLVMLGFWGIENYQVVATWSVANYVDIAANMVDQSNYGLAILQSLYVSTTTALWAVLLCYPFALAIVFAVPQRWQRLVLLLAVAPFWTSYILRLYAWQILLAKRGIINAGFDFIGLPGVEQAWIYTQVATRIGLIHYLAPILIVVLYVTINNIDRTLIEAARELGATRLQAFRRVILPLSRTGIILSASFATIISFGDVLSGSLLGGGAGPSALGSLPLYSNLVIREYASSTNLPRTAAMAMILVLIMVSFLVASFWATERSARRDAA
ncbi:ABC transporter permease [Zavarzinia sp. CC-PAN008]|uniref:ABC transporter permease n=1 Tax=Zavarzinia sp. CC-PAN008 TaxID=3243332 RepID=UPI003F749796